MQKVQAALTILAIVALIGGGIVLNVEVAKAGVCGGGSCASLCDCNTPQYPNYSCSEGGRDMKCFITSSCIGWCTW